jgi:ATPase subunit of ABC transporter with duplicated ATPase domains
VPQEVFGHDELSPMDILLKHHEQMKDLSLVIAHLEEELDLLDETAEDYAERVEEICNRISELEDGSANENSESESTRKAREALLFFGVDESSFDIPTIKLSGGVRKKIALACVLMEMPQLILLDEPTNHMDFFSICRLRQLIATCSDTKTTIVLVSHDVDLLNDVATDVIHFHDHKLDYYSGNYDEYKRVRRERVTCQLKQAKTLETQRSAIAESIDNMKKKATSTDNRSAKKKINKAIASKTKKLERHGIEKNEKGHRRTAQNDGGIRIGSINAIDASTRNQLTHKQLLKRAEVDISPIPDKAVQFDFRDTSSTWCDEPLVSLLDVGFGYGADDNLLFDCVEMSIREKSRVTIIGENATGKSTLLGLIAGVITPLHGTCHRASGLSIGYFHQHSADNFISENINSDGLVTALSFLQKKFPSKTEQDIRGELTRFGLSPKQAGTNVRFLSGGERTRLSMATMMLEDPQLLIIDEISNLLDSESVEALIYGLNKWTGTIIMTSHDTNLIRSVGDPNECYVLFDGMLRRIEGGIDRYLQIAFTTLKER